VIRLVCALSLLLAACNNPRAEEPASFWPWTWGDKTLAQSLEEGCAGGATETIIDGSTYPCVATEPADPIIPCPTEEEPAEAIAPPPVIEEPVIEEVEPTPSWVGDDFGVEMAFPANIVGPAIAEVWDGASFCALVKVNADESLNWPHKGAYWQAGSQLALDARWPHHSAEYDDPKCHILESVSLMP